MTSETFEKNLALLKKHHPLAFERLQDSEAISGFEISPSNIGAPTLSYTKGDKSKIYLLSKYDPLREAKRFIESLNVNHCTNFVVLGMGLGYQIEKLIDSVPEHSKIFVIESNRSMARLAMESNDLVKILNYSGLTLIFPENRKEIISCLEAEKYNFCLNGYQLIHQNSLTEVDRIEYGKIQKELKSFFQATNIELKTQAVKSKQFYKNISQNFKNLISSPGINHLNNLFQNVPAIICSAGPSLDKNIHYLKAKRDNYLLISVATALNCLIKNNIYPDFVLAVDPHEVSTHFFVPGNHLRDIRLVYDPVIPPGIPEFFKNKSFTYDSSINLARWFQKQSGGNGSLGNVMSVAHAAHQLSISLGCSPIIFIGQDLSFENKRLHSKNTYFHQRRENKIERFNTMDILDGLKFKKYSDHILERMDIFNNSIKTTVAMDTYSQMFSADIRNPSKTFNSTEGGLGIKGVGNHLLREIIYKICPKNVASIKAKAFNSITPKSIPKTKLVEAAKHQYGLLNQIHSHLSTVEEKYLNETLPTEKTKESFTQEMNKTIKNLLKNEETTLLLQGYDFSGFSLWNQKTNEILRRKSLAPSKNLINEEFQRDQEFFGVLKNSVEFNKNAFKKLMATCDSL
ncbi:MAG: 6-hydroxymethylpterin diphosphokinase MptE-like protein [Nitrospinota bacterium]